MVVMTFEQLLKAAIMTLATPAMLITMAGSVHSSKLGESDAQNTCMYVPLELKCFQPFIYLFIYLSS